MIVNKGTSDFHNDAVFGAKIFTQIYMSKFMSNISDFRDSSGIYNGPETSDIPGRSTELKRFLPVVSWQSDSGHVTKNTSGNYTCSTDYSISCLRNDSADSILSGIQLVFIIAGECQ